MDPKNIVLVTIKELKDIFISPIAYIVLTAFLIVAGIIFNLNLFVENQANLRKLFEILPVVFIILIAATTMRAWAEERREGNLEVVLSLPLSKAELIIGKILSNFIFSCLALIGTLTFVFTINLLGEPDNGVILASYLGLAILIISFILLGQAVSINTDNQIVAFIFSAIVITFLYVLGEPGLLKYLPNDWHQWLEAISISSHYRNIIKGVVDSRDILYFLSLNAFLSLIIYSSLQRISRKGK